MKLALIYQKDSPHTTGVYIENIIKQVGIKYSVFGLDNYSNIPKGFDLYFRIDHGDYKEDIASDLRPAVFYAIDTHLKKPYKKIKKQAGHYDLIFCAHKNQLEKLRRDTGKDVQWIPVACEPQIHKKLNLEKVYDVGFVGRDAKKFSRGRRLNLLRGKYPNSSIGAADFMKMSEIYSRSKIGFNSSIVGDINMRMFEIMSCGTFLLTNKDKKSGFDELFEDGKHLVSYRNDKEMLSLIDYYLEHEQERERIAKAGYELVIKQHTYYNRVQKMFNYIAFKFGGEFNQLRI